MADPDDFADELGDEPATVNGAEVIDLGRDVDPLLRQWARFRTQFAEAMSEGFWTIEDLEQRIAHRRACHHRRPQPDHRFLHRPVHLGGPELPAR